MIWVDDSGISAGAMTTMSTPMMLSIQDIALRQKLPVIHLVESAGANLMNFTVENWINAGGIFRNLARLRRGGHSDHGRVAWVIDGRRCLHARHV